MKCSLESSCLPFSVCPALLYTLMCTSSDVFRFAETFSDAVFMISRKLSFRGYVEDTASVGLWYFCRLYLSIIEIGQFNPFPNKPWFLAPLAEGQRAIVMALCQSCMPASVRPSVCPCMCAWVLASVNSSFKKLLLRNYWLDFYEILQECSLGGLLFQIPSNNCVLWRILVAMAMAIKVKNL